VKPAPFAYLRPDSVDKALSVLARYGADARVIAGGQSLGAMLNMRLVRPNAVLDINHLGELNSIVVTEDAVTTGAMVVQADALADKRLRDAVPLLTQALPHVGHYQTRNRGTLGGSVAHADPSAEVPLVLAVLGGEVELRSRRQRRWLKAADFFKSALVTARAPDELVTALRWPRSAVSNRYFFTEFAARDGDYAIVAVGCMIGAGNPAMVRLGFGGCGEAPQIVELPWQPSGGCAEVAEMIARDAAARIECRSDLLASSDYRRQLAAVLAREALRAAEAQDKSHA
jgi:2-furoyl-CoA dehydrogenase FAD binding subunit